MLSQILLFSASEGCNCWRSMVIDNMHKTGILRAAMFDHNYCVFRAELGLILSK